MLGYITRATPVEWLTVEMINLEEEIRNLKSKWKSNYLSGADL